MCAPADFGWRSDQLPGLRDGLVQALLAVVEPPERQVRVQLIRDRRQPALATPPRPCCRGRSHRRRGRRWRAQPGPSASASAGLPPACAHPLSALPPDRARRGRSTPRHPSGSPSAPARTRSGPPWDLRSWRRTARRATGPAGLRQTGREAAPVRRPPAGGRLAPWPVARQPRGRPRSAAGTSLPCRRTAPRCPADRRRNRASPVRARQARIAG